MTTGKRRERKAPPLALEAVDLLAGLGPGIELEADDLPAGVSGAPAALPMTTTVEEIGRLIRSGEPTVRRLIRAPVLRPTAADPDAPAVEPEHDPEKPGE